MSGLRGAGRLLFRFRYFVVVAAAVLVAASLKLPSLSSEVKTNNTQFLPRQAPSLKAASLAKEVGGASVGAAQVLIIAWANGHPLSPSQIAEAESAAKVAASIRGTSKALAVGLSEDGKAYEVVAFASVPAYGPSPQGSRYIHDLRRSLERFQSSSLRFYVTGALASYIDNQKATTRAEDTSGRYSIIIILVLLFLIFRSLLAPILALLPSFLALLASQHLVGEAARAGLATSDVTTILLVVLVLGAGTDYALFFVFRLKEELTNRPDFEEAFVRAYAAAAPTILFSGLTVAAALCCLVFSEFGAYKGLGPALAIGIGTVVVADLTFLPAIFAIAKKAAFFPSRLGAQGKTSRWARVAQAVVSRPAAAIAGCVVGLGALAGFLSAYRAGGFGSPTVSATNSQSAVGEQILTQHFSEASYNPLSIIFELRKPVFEDPQAVARAYSLLQSSGLYSSIEGPLNPGGVKLTTSELQLLAYSAPGNHNLSDSPLQALKLYVSSNGRVIRFDTTLTAGSAGSNKAIEQIPTIRKEVKKVAENIGAQAYGVTGMTAALYDIAHYSTQDLEHIVPIVLAFLLLILAAVLRSVLAPFYLVASVALSYFASLGFVVLAFQLIGKQSGTVFVLPFLMFIFIMALGEDYNILVTRRIKEENAKAPLREAVPTAIGYTGVTVTAAGLILAGTFLSLTATASSYVREIGVGLAFGVLLDTFLIRSIVVPAVVALMGRLSFYPSKTRI